jgi:hypothetical protein
MTFHRLGAIALAVTLGVGGLLLWLSASDAQDVQAHQVFRLGFRVWVVAAGVFWAWYLREESRRANPSHFSDSLPFVEHLQLLAGFDGAADATAALLGAGRTASAVVAVGSAGYNARLRRIEGAADGRLRLAVQLLKPATALPFLPLGAATKVLIDGGPSGAGEVIQLAPASRR